MEKRQAFFKEVMSKSRADRLSELRLHIGDYVSVENNRLVLESTDTLEDRTEAAILHGAEHTAELIDRVLRNEQEALKRVLGLEVDLQSLEEYIQLLLDRGIIKQELVDNPRFRVGFVSRLFEHWKRAEEQIEHNFFRVASWDDYYDPETFKSTPSRKSSFLESLEYFSPEYVLFGSALSEDSQEYQHPYFLTPFVSHTTHVAAAFEIINSGYFDSALGVNFSASAVVAKSLDDYTVTFILRTADLFATVPLIYNGNSTTEGENEISSYFPVPVELAVGIFYTKELKELLDVTSLDKSGYYQFPLLQDE